MGKGSKRRPQKVDEDTMRQNWERIFGKRDKKPKDDRRKDK